MPSTVRPRALRYRWRRDDGRRMKAGRIERHQKGDCACTHHRHLTLAVSPRPLALSSFLFSLASLNSSARLSPGTKDTGRPGAAHAYIREGEPAPARRHKTMLRYVSNLQIDSSFLALFASGHYTNIKCSVRLSGRGSAGASLRLLPL